MAKYIITPTLVRNLRKWRDAADKRDAEHAQRAEYLKQRGAAKSKHR